MLSKKELFNAKSSANKIEAGLTIDVVNTGEYPDMDIVAKDTSKSPVED